MKVAVYFGTGFEELEAITVVDVLRRGGVEVLMVGVNGKTVKSRREIEIIMDATIEEVDHSQLEMMILPGGIPGVDNLVAHPILVEHLKQFKEQGKWIAAICAAPGRIGELGFVKGEKATVYPGDERKLIGATVVNAPVVVSNHLVTSQGPGTSLQFAYTLLEILKGEETAKKIAAGMLINL